MKDALTKQLIFFDVLKEVISIFGETEVGTNEVDIDSVASYLTSEGGFKFAVDLFDYNTREDIEAYITDKILDGFPVWRFLKCSDWTKQMIEKEFLRECEKEQEELSRKYKCFTCEYFKTINTSIGIIYECNKDAQENRYRMKRRENIELPRKNCENYINRNKYNIEDVNCYE